MPAQSASVSAPASGTPADFAAMRRAMVDSQLRTSDVTDPAIVAAVLAVAREAHVPTERQAATYIDRAIPLGNGRALNPPLTTARLIATADVRHGDSVLLIGGATGYAAAVLAQLGAKVTMVESDAPLLAIARNALSGVAGVTIVEAVMADGAASGAPYDRVIIDGAINAVPSAIAVQLADGGILATGVADRGVTRIAQAIGISGTALRLVPVIEIECVPLPGFATPARFAF